MFGVNVYVPEFWLSTMEGLQVPIMPLPELPGRVGTPVPAHTDNDVPKLNAGTTLGVTVTENEVGAAQLPVAGVNV